MNKDKLTKELEELIESDYAPKNKDLSLGYRSGVLDCIDIVKESLLHDVSEIEEASSILKGYEQFEADIIADDEMWSPDAINGKHYDSMMILQERRNDFFAKKDKSRLYMGLVI